MKRYVLNRSFFNFFVEFASPIGFCIRMTSEEHTKVATCITCVGGCFLWVLLWLNVISAVTLNNRLPRSTCPLVSWITSITSMLVRRFARLRLVCNIKFAVSLRLINNLLCNKNIKSSGRFQIWSHLYTLDTLVILVSRRSQQNTVLPEIDLIGTRRL